jgi:hypothetical protein
MQSNEGQIRSDDRFIEIVEVNDQPVSKRDGTFPELIKQEAAARKKTLLRAPGVPSKADEVIKVARFVWDIVKDSKAEVATENSCTRLLSVKDDNWEHYGGALDFASDPVTYKLNNFAGVNCYRIKFRVAGTRSAMNPLFGGKWMPNIHVTFDQCEATFPWIVTGQAFIDAINVSNIGTVTEPVPQVVLTVKFKTNAKFVFNVESHERTFEFVLNAQTGAKIV